MAGADNTAAAICTTLFHILKSPSAHARVLSELDRARSAGRISAAPQHSEILKHCPYYVACVKESLRLNPSLPSFMPRYSSTDPKNPLVILGTVIPPGVEIASNPWITHRDPEIYGVDAEEWIPERWLDPDKAKLLEKYNFTFGYGSRLCLGRQLGMMAALKVPLMVSFLLEREDRQLTWI
jgi:cytochrome P450